MHVVRATCQSTLEPTRRTRDNDPRSSLQQDAASDGRGGQTTTCLPGNGRITPVSGGYWSGGNGRIILLVLVYNDKNTFYSSISISNNYRHTLLAPPTHYRDGEHRFTLFDVQKKRHELVRLYETVDGIR